VFDGKPNGINGKRNLHPLPEINSNVCFEKPYVFLKKIIIIGKQKFQILLTKHFP
jgi:hypothetical protein